MFTVGILVLCQLILRIIRVFSLRAVYKQSQDAAVELKQAIAIVKKNEMICDIKH